MLQHVANDAISNTKCWNVRLLAVVDFNAAAEANYRACCICIAGTVLSNGKHPRKRRGGR